MEVQCLPFRSSKWVSIKSKRRPRVGEREGREKKSRREGEKKSDREIERDRD